MMNIIRLALLFALLFVGIMIGAPPVQALLPQHSGLGCLGCHNLHGGSAGGLLTEADSESTCLSCHGLLNPFGITEVAVHDPVGYGQGSMGYITCRECHNPHDNIGSNIKLIGYAYDPETGREEGDGQIPALVSPAIRVELSTSDINNPGYRTVMFADVGDFNIDGTFPGPGVCQICHAPNHNVGADCSGCHPHDTGFKPKGCTSTGCHDGLGAGALAVSTASSHSTDIIFAATGVTYSCADCHSGHNSGTIEIPNNLTVGIHYGSNGENGIALGSSSVTGATEAEICWNCHGLYGVSEWGVNTDTNGVSFPDYDAGSLSTSNWVGTWDGAAGNTAMWSSANFSYKESHIQSTHSVNAVDGVSGKDVVGDLRCSYCHDVHDLNSAPGDATNGKPYLRGSWVGNPYIEDGAPSNDLTGGLPGDIANYSAYDLPGLFGAVPRGGTSYNSLGGYYIDQNSGNPTTDILMDSPDKFAGLCVLCHEGGNADGLWDPAEIDAINKFGVPGDDWVGTNGHAAVVKGGGGSVAENLFTMAKRHPTTAWAAYTSNGSHRGNPVMAYRNARNINKGLWVTNYWAQGMRGTDSTAFQYSPGVDTAIRQYNYGGYNWGATVVIENADGTMSDSGTDGNYHQFTCSKCHNPHASRLPRLLITNCLDTKHNGWDDSIVTLNDPALAAENRSISFSQATSAQNCHRLADPGFPQSGPQGTMSGGWNRVSPW